MTPGPGAEGVGAVVTSEAVMVATTGAVSLAVISVIWLLGVTRWNDDLSLIDGYYGSASLVHAGLTLALWSGHTGRGVALGLVAMGWAVGLGQSMTRRWFKHRHGGGDSRYRDAADRLKLSGAGFWWKSYLPLAASQAFLLVLLNLPLQFAIMSDRAGLSVLDIVGLVVAAVGAVVEVVANRQLEVFRAARSDRPRTLSSGLWGWSRHPNYFGHFLVFLGCFLVAVGDPGLWWTGASPLVIGIVLRFGSGVRMTDNLMLRKRSDDPVYLDYVRRTSPFMLRPPRKLSVAAGDGTRGPDA